MECSKTKITGSYLQNVFVSKWNIKKHLKNVESSF